MIERRDHLYELMIGALNRRDYGAYKNARTAYIAAIEQLEAQVREEAFDPYDRDKLKAAVVHVLALSRLDPALVKALSDRLAAGEYRLNRPRDRGTVDVTIYRPGLHQTTADPEHGHREFSDQELRAFRTVKTLSRAMSLTDAAGGYLVPFQLDPTVILTSSGGTNPIRQLARKVVATGDVWSRISSAGITASWDAEAAEVSDDPPTFAQPQVPVWKQSAFVPISIEAYEDEATALTGTASEVDRTGTTLDAVDFFSLQEALPAAGRPTPLGSGIW